MYCTNRVAVSCPLLAGEKAGLTTEELEELRRLRKENRTLRMERDLLKKAAAYFARESETG